MRDDEIIVIEASEALLHAIRVAFPDSVGSFRTLRPSEKRRALKAALEALQDEPS